MPYFLRYYGSFADRIFVYDAFSTDKTRDIVRCCDKAQLVDFHCNEINDLRFLDICNEEYKKHSRGVADWVICVDIDEFVYHPDILTELSKYLDLGVTLLQPYEYYIVCDEPPCIDGQIFEEARSACRNDPKWGKVVAFRPELDVNFDVGKHRCKPEPRSYVIRPKFTDLATLHFIYLGEQFYVEKIRRRRQRLSALNKEKNWGYHFMVDDDTALQDYRIVRSQAEPISVEEGRSFWSTNRLQRHYLDHRKAGLAGGRAKTP